MACLIAATCGEEEEDGDPSVTVPCGTCAAGTSHMNQFLAGGDEPDAPIVFAYDIWHYGVAPDCVVTVELDDVDACPFATAPGIDTVVEHWTDADDVEHQRLYCALPRLEAPLDCDAATGEYPEDTTELGWYYCQDDDENYDQACDPTGPFAGIDEDGDGNTDCDDVDCEVCEVCGGTGVGCHDSYHYTFRFTAPANEHVSGGCVTFECAQCTVEETAGVDCVVDSQVVGRQCAPSSFVEPELELFSGTEYAVELSPECGGGPCLTRMERNGMEADSAGRYDYCTCRCGDLEGNDHTTNPDLCQCPGESVCEPICEYGSICPVALQGSFCMPTCTAHPCVHPGACTPPASGDPWNWTCEG